jgi:hypothetical protein
MNHRHPETPTCTPSGLALDDEDPDDEDDDTPGGNPPDDEGGDLDDEPDHDEDLNAQDHVFMQLSEAINNLTHNNQRTSFSDNSKVKVRELDIFDGSEPRKLRTSFVQCELNFQSKPKTFCSDRAKVNFAQSFLRAWPSNGLNLTSFQAS